jgi:sugar/nucleoside kinase (ribokinase family)
VERDVRREFEAEAISTDLLTVVDRPMPFVSVALNHDDDRGFVSYIGGRDEDDDALWRTAFEVVERMDAGHLHGYAGEAPPGFAARARERGMTVSLDAWSGSWWEHSDSLEELLGSADVFLANEAEARTITGEADPERALDRMAAHCRCVVIKRGARGAVGAKDDQIATAPAEPAHVLDATGAGDCFNAGFLLGWLADLPLEHSLALGNICGARAVEAIGGYRGCPGRDEMRRIAGERGISVP